MGGVETRGCGGSKRKPKTMRGSGGWDSKSSALGGHYHCSAPQAAAGRVRARRSADVVTTRQQPAGRAPESRGSTAATSQPVVARTSMVARGLPGRTRRVPQATVGLQTGQCLAAAGGGARRWQSATAGVKSTDQSPLCGGCGQQGCTECHVAVIRWRVGRPHTSWSLCFRAGTRRGQHAPKHQRFMHTVVGTRDTSPLRCATLVPLRGIFLLFSRLRTRAGRGSKLVSFLQPVPCCRLCPFPKSRSSFFDSLYEWATFLNREAPYTNTRHMQKKPYGHQLEYCPQTRLPVPTSPPPARRSPIHNPVIREPDSKSVHTSVKNLLLPRLLALPALLTAPKRLPLILPRRA